MDQSEAQGRLYAHFTEETPGWPALYLEQSCRIEQDENKKAWDIYGHPPHMFSTPPSW